MSKKFGRKQQFKEVNPLDFKIKFEFKNEKQREYNKLIKDKEITICSGVAGSGKSYVSLATSLQLITNKHNEYEQIIIIVPTVEAGNMQLGFLKGSKEEKISPYVDADLYTIEKILKSNGFEKPRDKIKELINEGIIKVECLSFVRGKTFSNAIVLLNEAENFSKDEIYLLLTRIGENSKYIISGDTKQLDRKDIKRSGKMCGLEYVSRILKHMDEIGTCTFEKEDIVRNPLIGKIMDAFEDGEFLIREQLDEKFYIETGKGEI